MTERTDTVTQYNSARMLRSLCCLDLRGEGWRTARCPGGRLDWGRLWQGSWAWASDPQRRSRGPCVAETEAIWGPRCSLTSHTHIAQVNPGEKTHHPNLPLASSMWTYACPGLHSFLACGYQESMLGKTLLLRRLPKRGSVQCHVGWFIVQSSIIITGTQRNLVHVAFSLSGQLFLKWIPVEGKGLSWCHKKQTETLLRSHVPWFSPTMLRPHGSCLVFASFQNTEQTMFLQEAVNKSSTCLSYVFLDS